MVASRPGPRTSIQTLLDLARQIDHRLAGRIAAADQRHLLAGAQLAPRSARPSSGREAPSKASRSVDVEPAVARAAGDHHRAGAHRLAVGQAQAKRPSSRRGAALATSSGMAISTPNFCAWLKARPISAMPVMPVGKPR